MITINKLVSNSITITTGPVVKAETHIKFVDGTEGDYLIEGAMDFSALIEAGLMPSGSGKTQEPSWIKYPAEVEIGSAVTSIGGSYTFYKCRGLTSMVISNSVRSIGSSTFSMCYDITSVTFSGRDKATVQGMSNYSSWELPHGCVLHCTDGDITL